MHDSNDDGRGGVLPVVEAGFAESYSQHNGDINI